LAAAARLKAFEFVEGGGQEPVEVALVLGDPLLSSVDR
jgi:hypothetical protein